MSQRSFRKEPLYRKENRRTHRAPCGGGSEYRWQRNTKGEAKAPDRSMHSGHRHGRDYTPLFRFLISRVGHPWNAVFAEAVSRLDEEREPIFWLVAERQEDAREIVRCGESTFYSGLFVDDAGVLQKTNPDLTAKTMKPSCQCCTHTFNGEVFGVRKTLDDFAKERRAP